MELAGTIIIAIGAIFMFFGIIGLFRFKNFYTRILVSAKIDTVGVVTIIIGLVVKHGLGFFSLKLLLLMCIMLILNPLVSHIIARTAYLSGYKAEGDNNEMNEGGDV